MGPDFDMRAGVLFITHFIILPFYKKFVIIT
jgi:hypothetical protein